MRMEQNRSQHTTVPPKCWLIVLACAAPHTCSPVWMSLPRFCKSLLSGTSSLPSCLGKFLIHHASSRYNLFSMASFLHFPGKEGFIAPVPCFDDLDPCTVLLWHLSPCKKQMCACFFSPGQLEPGPMSVSGEQSLKEPQLLG